MGERAYLYAKACGIFGKSFLDKRISSLRGVNQLADMDRLVFPQSSHILPERELLVDLEYRLIDRAVQSIIRIVKCYADPPELFKILISGYEYADLKTALASSIAGETAAPVITDIGEFGTVHFDAWPDIPAMIRDTEFEFLLDKEGVFNQELRGISLQTVLDRHYYNSLWKALFKIPKKDRIASEMILSEEISLRNAVWALRLRTYYWMPEEEVKLHLIYIPSEEGKEDSLNAAMPKKKQNSYRSAFEHNRKHTGHNRTTLSLTDDAIESLNLALDNHAEWASWKRAEFLNPEIPGEAWHADPRYFQNAASEYLYHLARSHFHRHPFSIDTAFCFIKFKQFEEDLLTSIAEGLGLGISSSDVFSLLEVEP
jgi:vacuolar-type H+-ATPase subunit C/Vma6